MLLFSMLSSSMFKLSTLFSTLFSTIFSMLSMSMLSLEMTTNWTDSSLGKTPAVKALLSFPEKDYKNGFLNFLRSFPEKKIKMNYHFFKFS
jgi:hypothetical protein